MKLRLAFGHKAHSGKDTAANVIENHYMDKSFNVKVCGFANALYECAGNLQQFLGKPREKDRSLLQMLGEGLRNIYGRDLWVDTLHRTKLINAHQKADIVCITDLRYKNEFQRLRELGYVLIKIQRDDRPDIGGDPNHPSEVDLDDVEFDHVLMNNGTLEEFELSVLTLVDRLLHPSNHT